MRLLELMKNDKVQVLQIFFKSASSIRTVLKAIEPGTNILDLVSKYYTNECWKTDLPDIMLVYTQTAPSRGDTSPKFTTTTSEVNEPNFFSKEQISRITVFSPDSDDYKDFILYMENFLVDKEKHDKEFQKKVSDAPKVEIEPKPQDGDRRSSKID